MPSFKSVVTGLVALLAADAVIAGPCRPSVTTTGVSASSSATSSSDSTDTETYTVSTGTTTSAATETSTTEIISLSTATSSETSLSETASTGTTLTTEIASTTSTIPSTTETATSTEASSTESSTATTTSAEETSTTSAIASTTTSEAPATLPTIANANFDDNTNGAPWVRSGPASVSNGAVFWKYSEPNVMVMRPETSITQEITGLRPNLGYRIRFIYVEFDTPSATAGCRVTASFGGESIGEVPTVPPRTPNNQFEEFVSTVYLPSTTSAELKIGFTCVAPGQQNRYYVENVSIEFAE